MKGKYTLEEPEWDDISPDAKDLVRKMLEYDPSKRYSAMQALQHKWIVTHTSLDKVDKSIASKTLSNLRNFRGELKLKRATMAFIASQLVSKEETRDLEKMFKQLDKNGDGMLSKEEIIEGYEEIFGIPINEEEVDKLMKEVDLDGNGSIDYTEFVMSTLSEKTVLTNDKL